MDIPDGQDKVGEVLSFQLLDVSKREGEEGNHEWMLINSNQNEGKRVGLDSRLRGNDEGWFWELGIYIDLYLLIISVNDLFFEPSYGVVFVEFSSYFVVGCYGLESHFFVEVE